MMIYIIKDIGTGLYKIGRSNNVKNRRSNLNTGNSSLLDIIHTIHSDNALLDEKYLHCIFKHQKVRGEWFRLNDSIITWLKSIKVNVRESIRKDDD